MTRTRPMPGIGRTRRAWRRNPVSGLFLLDECEIVYEGGGGIFVPPPEGGGGGGPVAFGAISQSTFDTSADGTHTVSHTAVSGSNVAALVLVGVKGSNSASTCSYGGTGMTAVGSVFSTGANDWHLHAFVLANPPTGAQTVTSTVTFPGDMTTHYLVVMSFTGVNQSTPAGALFTNSGTAATQTVTVTSVGADDLVVDFAFVWTAGSPIDEGAGQTQRGTTEALGGTDCFSQSTEAGSGSIEMTWDVTGCDAWGSIALRLISA